MEVGACVANTVDTVMQWDTGSYSRAHNASKTTAVEETAGERWVTTAVARSQIDSGVWNYPCFQREPGVK